MPALAQEDPEWQPASRSSLAPGPLILCPCPTDRILRAIALQVHAPERSGGGGQQGQGRYPSARQAGRSRTLSVPMLRLTTSAPGSRSAWHASRRGANRVRPGWKDTRLACRSLFCCFGRKGKEKGLRALGSLAQQRGRQPASHARQAVARARAAPYVSQRSTIVFRNASYSSRYEAGGGSSSLSFVYHNTAS